jgi:hypothetical protein
MRIATDPNVAETYIYSMWGGTPIQGPAPASNTTITSMSVSDDLGASGTENWKYRIGYDLT